MAVARLESEEVEALVRETWDALGGADAPEDAQAEMWLPFRAPLHQHFRSRLAKVDLVKHWRITRTGPPEWEALGPGTAVWLHVVCKSRRELGQQP